MANKIQMLARIERKHIIRVLAAAFVAAVAIIFGIDPAKLKTLQDNVEAATDGAVVEATLDIRMCFNDAECKDRAGYYCGSQGTCQLEPVGVGPSALDGGLLFDAGP